MESGTFGFEPDQRFGAQIQEAATEAGTHCTIDLDEQCGGFGRVTRGQGRHVAAAGGNGFGNGPGTRTPVSQSGPEWDRMLHQQPVSGRDRHAAPTIRFQPSDNRRESPMARHGAGEEGDRILIHPAREGLPVLRGDDGIGGGRVECCQSPVSAGAGIAVINAGEASRGGNRSKAVDRAGSQVDFHLTGALHDGRKTGTAGFDQIQRGTPEFPPEGLREHEGMGAIEFRIDQHEARVDAVGGVSPQGDDRGSGGFDAGESGTVEEARMRGQEVGEVAEFVDDVVRVSPVEAAGGMDVELFGGAPLDAVGVPESANDTGEGAEAVAVDRPTSAFRSERRMRTGAAGREAGVVVGFAVVHERAVFVRCARGVLEIASEGLRTGVLEEFAVGPLHAAFREQGVGGFPRSPKTLEKEHGVRELLPDTGGDELPDMDRDLVPGVAPEGIDPATAPGEEHLGEIVPQRDVPLVELHEIFPDDIPGPRAVEPAIRMPDEPFGMLVPFATAPTGVVDDEVQHQAALSRMDGAGEFDELIDTRRALVELDQRWIDGREVLQGVRRTKSAEACESGRGGTDREQVQDAAAQAVEDVGQFLDQASKGSARWNDRPTGAVQSLQFRRRMGRGGCLVLLRPWAEHPRERAVEDVRRPGPRRMDRDPGVRPVRPVLVAVGINRKSLGAEETHLGQR